MLMEITMKESGSWDCLMDMVNLYGLMVNDSKDNMWKVNGKVLANTSLRMEASTKDIGWTVYSKERAY